MFSEKNNMNVCSDDGVGTIEANHNTMSLSDKISMIYDLTLYGFADKIKDTELCMLNRIDKETGSKVNMCGICRYVDKENTHIHIIGDQYINKLMGFEKITYDVLENYRDEKTISCGYTFKKKYVSKNNYVMYILIDV